MPKPITARIPHALGADEAHRRIQEGFGRLRQQLTGGLVGLVTYDDRWEGNQLHFTGGTLGQKITGRINVLPDVVEVELELPEILAAIASRIEGKLKKEGQLLLERKK